jgi:hypothetical protein
VSLRSQSEVSPYLSLSLPSMVLVFAFRQRSVFEECRLLWCYAVWFLQEPHNVTSQKMAFFIVTAAKSSNLKKLLNYLLAVPHTLRLQP